MKFAILFVVGLVAYVAAESEPIRIRPFPPQDISKEGILQNIGKIAKAGLKELLKEVGKGLISKVKDIITDGIHLSSTKQVNEGLEAVVPSTEAIRTNGVIEVTGDLILGKASELANQHAAIYGASQEGIISISGFGNIHKIHEAEELISAYYNKSIKYGGLRHEGILGGLGGISIRGYHNIIGPKNIDFGDILGHVFYVVPRFPISREGIIPEQPSQEGILSSAGKLILKGAGKFAREILRGVFGPVHDILANIFLARGNFFNYPNIKAAAHEIILEARQGIHHNLHPDAKPCVKSAERNFTLLMNNYLKNGHECGAVAHPQGRKIISHVQDIVFDAVKRVEDTHREIDFCFEKHVEANKLICLDEDIPEKIAQHREKIHYYGEVLAHYLKQFSDLNTGFDVCLVGHLGVVRREVYRIVQHFHKCVDSFPPEKFRGKLPLSLKVLKSTTNRQLTISSKGLRELV